MIQKQTHHLDRLRDFLYNSFIMCKLKTKSAIKKRFMIKKNGTIVARCIGKRHNLRKRSTKLKKFKTGFHIIPNSDVNLIKRCARYGIK